MKTSRNHNMDRARSRANIRRFDAAVPIGTRVKLRDGTETRTFSHGGMDVHGAACVFVESQQEPVEINALEIL